MPVQRTPFAALPEGKFGAILIDPPWAYESWSGKLSAPTRAKGGRYVTHDVATLKLLPLRDVMARDCAVFVWVIDPHIEQMFDLTRHWGLKYSTKIFNWRKRAKNGGTKPGLGKWTRKETELCFLFKRGSPRRLRKDVPEFFDEPARAHSRKPDGQYARIEALVRGPYLELFATQDWPGWTSWGNQVGKFEREKV